MSKEKFKELMKDERSAGEVPTPGSVGQLLGKVWDEMAPVAAHGAHELASALLSNNNSAFVMYPHHGKENVGAELPMAEEIGRSPETGRDGMEM